MAQYVRLVAVVVALLLATPALPQRVSLSIERIDGPSFTATGITGALRIAGATTLDLQVGELAIAGSRWRNVRVTCPDFRQERHDLVCAQGALEGPVPIPLAFRYSTLNGNLDLALRPAANEAWRLSVESRAPARMVRLAVENGLLTRLAPWWPAAWPQATAGSISGTLTFSEAKDARAGAEVTLSGVGFSDQSGLHAGEKIAAALELQAQRRAGQWQWQSRLEWKSGDVFWQPFFVSGAGHALDAAGTMDAKRIAVERGALRLSGIGNCDFSAAIDRMAGRLAGASFKTVNADVAAVYEKLLKPALQGSVLGDMRGEGRVDAAVDLRDGKIAAVDLTLKRVSVEDRQRRFGLFGVDGRLPWRSAEATSAQLHIDGAELLQLPFGAFELPLEMRGVRVRMRQIEVPVLDGRLTVDNFSADGESESWRWRFSGGITPISMQQFTTALGLPVMHGTLSAVIPSVSYRRSTLQVAGALLFKVFDGTVVARNLVLEDPLGKVPRLTADVDMRNLDLDLLTRAFSFGAITGRIDANVKALELVNWEPVRFDASIASSAGEYPRRISQTAVQNISALGGAGAAAAIQRSFLHFFEHFGYSALGLSCRLDNDVCHMGGIADAPQGYVIVKGGGIPAINVLGYNRAVGWHELIERLKRVTRGNVIVR